MRRRVHHNISTANTLRQRHLPVGVVIVDADDSYNESGKTPLDKIDQVQYCLGNTAITVQRFFDKTHPKYSLIKGLIEDQAQKCYNEIGNIAVASIQREGS